jgi:predicted ester cyclase
MHDNAVHEHTNHVTRRRVLAAGAVSAVAALTGSSAADGAAKSNQSLKERRLAVVRRHMSTENDDEFAQTLATFRRPRYEFIATGEVDNGRKAVDGYYNSIESAFPDEHTSDWRMRYAPGEDGDRDAVVVEFLFTGTQKRAFMGIPASGRHVSVRMTAFFLFPKGSDRLDDERVYLDAGTLLMQLGVIPKLYPGWTGPLER